MSRFSPLKTYVPWYLVANPRSSDTHRSCHGNVATLAFERKKRARNYDDIYSSLLCQEQQFLEFWALQPTMIPKASSPSIAARQRRSTFKKTKWDKKGFSCLYISIVVKKKSIWQAVAIVRFAWMLLFWCSIENRELHSHSQILIISLGFRHLLHKIQMAIYWLANTGQNGLVSIRNIWCMRI